MFPRSLSLARSAFPFSPLTLNRDSEQYNGLVNAVPLVKSDRDLKSGRLPASIYGTPAVEAFHNTARTATRFDASANERLFYDYDANYVTLPLTITGWIALAGDTSTYYSQDFASVAVRSATRTMMLIGVAGSPGDVNTIRAWHFLQGESGAVSATVGTLPFFTPIFVAGRFRSLSYRDVFYNGVYQDQNTTTITANSAWDRFAIGSRGDDPSPTDFLHGWAWDLRVYNRELSAGEIERMYLPQTRYELYQPVDRQFWSIPVVSVADERINRDIFPVRQPVPLPLFDL